MRNIEKIDYRMDLVDILVADSLGVSLDSGEKFNSYELLDIFLNGQEALTDAANAIRKEFGIEGAHE